MMPSHVLDGIQSILETLCCDCYNADVFTSGLGAKTNLDRWQVAVDTIWRFYKCGFIWSPTHAQAKEGISALDWSSYLSELTKADPIAGNYDDYGIWKSREICATDLAVQIVERFSLKYGKQSLRNEFAEFISKRYCEHGVPWRSDALLAVQQS